MTETNPTETSQQSPGEVVAKGDIRYRVKMIIVSLAIIVYCGGFFLYDGFIGWPDRNQRIAELRKQEELATDPAEKEKFKDQRFKEGKEKSQADILLQKIIGFIALPGGIYMLIHTMRKSRGQIRMKDQTISVPGHPPVPFEAITTLDNRLWDKKGIAYVSYSLPAGRNGKFMLDDIIYQRPPIDQMYDAIVAYLNPEGEEPAGGDEPVQPPPRNVVPNECPRCKSENPVGVQFCRNCGLRFSTQPEN